LNVLKVNVENSEKQNNIENFEDIVSTTSKAVTSADIIIEDVKEKHVVEEKKEEAKEEVKETFERVEENIKNILQNGYGNLKDFVESNGGVQNLLTIFKDDIVSLKDNVCTAFKKNFGGCERKRECGRKKEKSKKLETVEEFKAGIEQTMDKMFNKMKQKLVKKMVKKYEKLVGEDSQKEGAAIHHGYTCDGCEAHPIVGTRYRCTFCPDFDFCEKCHGKEEHHKDHAFKKIKEETRRRHHHHRLHQKEEVKPEANNTEKSDVAVHKCVSCDGCGASPIKGIRYKCIACPNFDFCEKCHAQGSHNKDHSFTKIEKPLERHQYWRNIRENRCNFFQNLFNNFGKVEPKKEEQKPVEKKEENGYEFLVKEMKELYQLQNLDDQLILSALQKSNGDVNEALNILFA